MLWQTRKSTGSTAIPRCHERPASRVQKALSRSATVAIRRRRSQRPPRPRGGQVSPAWGLSRASHPKDLVQSLYDLCDLLGGGPAETLADTFHGERSELADLDP